MEVDGEQAALDEVRLDGLAQPDGDVGLAHVQVQLVILQDEMELHLRVEVDELVDARRQPRRAEPDGGGHPQHAGGQVAGIGQPRLYGVELHHHLAGGAEQVLALLGQHQTAGMPVEQRHPEFLLERRHLPAHRRLAHVERLARMGEAARLGRRVKDLELVPVHPTLPPPPLAIIPVGHAAPGSGRSGALVTGSL